MNLKKLDPEMMVAIVIELTLIAQLALILLKLGGVLRLSWSIILVLTYPFVIAILFGLLYVIMKHTSKRK